MGDTTTVCASATQYLGDEVDCTHNGGPGVCIQEGQTNVCYAKCGAGPACTEAGTQWFTIPTRTAEVCYCAVPH